MGTNFYAHIIPTKKRKDEIKTAIDANDFSLINKLVQETYGSLEMSYEDEDLIGGVVHLGKRSGGWKFLWNPNVYVVRNGHMEDVNGTRRYIPDPDTPLYLYPLTKKGIKAFIDREDVEIYDEYGVKQDKETFFKEALEWTTWRGETAWDSDSYEAEHPNEFHPVLDSALIRLLESEGFKLSNSKSDFYSDGLRFSTYIDFS